MKPNPFNPVWRLGTWLKWKCRITHHHYRYDNGSFGGCDRCHTSWHIGPDGRKRFSATVDQGGQIADGE